ncbi:MULTISPECIES: RND family transporter [unclassified Colwellia]|uniref:efflux RND transporter permease subunit n=1 Tax=unclassified Colwellia TaxID=196834 RepID=UPI0015F6FBE0|nr:MULTISPECIES: MMPL family transporter [unclassified Colwellia]MBA6357906.1 MMPL family transporter [Colwellia sp. BRX8-3]MBA6361712.1 MMPL family transporter [Colwellia sp. BRX8-6]MBA6369498.1 MMPL family transporter [Colwellia sp. BRX8-5]MBA6375855.1 MMPL family transporter [Colwellia sp. BRX8-2]MBA6384853.1 MMPL family transporter [Colwellia sp. BRX10-9]
MFKASATFWAYTSCIIFCILTATLAWQAKNFEIDASADTLLVDNNKHYILTQLASQRYGSEEFILIAFKPSNSQLFSTTNLDILSELGRKIEKIARVKQVNSIVNVPIFSSAKTVSADVEELTWENKKFDEQTFSLSLKKHPLYEGLLINKGQTALSLQVVFKTNKKVEQINDDIIDIKRHLLTRELTDKEQNALEALKQQQQKLNKQLEQTRIDEIEKIRALLLPYKKDGAFYLGGNNLLSYELIQIIQNDLVLFGALIILVVIVLLWFLFRQVSWVVLPIVCCATSVVMTIGLLAALDFKVTVISANVFALQIILSLAMIIHLIVHYQELVLKHIDWDHQTLVLATIKQKIKPCFYAGLTTSIGFGSLIFSGVQPVISFGWMMVVAMLVSFIVSLAFFPALLLVIFNKQGFVKQHHQIERGMTGAATFVINQPKKIIIISTLITLVGALGCLKLTAENSFLNYFSESTNVRKELTFIDQEFGGSTPFDLLLNIPDKQIKSGLVISASAVQTVTDIQNMLAKEQAIGAITSIADFTKIAQVVYGKPLTEYELTALYKSLDVELQQKLFGAYFSEKNNQIRISMRVQDSTKDLNRADLLAHIHKELSAMGIKEQQYTLTGLFILYQDVLSRLLDSQVLTILIVYGAMAITLMIIFSSFKVAWIALVPNFITTVVIMGVLGIFSIPLDLMTITIAAVAMGISMDDTIHYIHRYIEEMELGQANSDDWIKRTNLSIGYALIYTTTVIVIGFGTLIFSNFVPSILFGLLTSVAMIVALVTDITTLPVLLKKYLTKNNLKQS